MKRIVLIGLFILLLPTLTWAACDCTSSSLRGATSGSSTGNPDVGILISDPGVEAGNFIICEIAYDVFVHGVQPPDSSWTDIFDLQLGDGSGVSVFTQNYPGSYYTTAQFNNDSGLNAENWSYGCIARSYRSGIDGAVKGQRSGGTVSSMPAPAVTITQTLDDLVSIWVAAGATSMSSPTTGSFVASQSTHAPGIALAETLNPATSPTTPNGVTLSQAEVAGGISLALKCGVATTPTATATATATPTATATATATGVATATPTATATAAVQINHIVVLFGENHSFDNVFGTFPGARGTTSATLSTGGSYTLTHAPNQYASDMGHTFPNSLTDINGGSMNGFDLVGGCLSTGNPAYQCLSQYQQADIPNLWTLAQDFALGDNFFASTNGPSMPNHMSEMAASSFLVNSNVSNTLLTASWGCDAPIKTSDCTASHVPSYSCTGNGTCVGSNCGATTSASATRLGTTTTYPCFAQPTILDEMNTAGITWKYYGINTVGSNGYFWTAPNSFRSMTNGTSNWTSHVVSDTTFDTDAAAGNLPQVSFVSTAGGWSMHAPAPMCTGENYIVDKLNNIAAGGNTQWNSTIVVWTVDEWGGTYDHVNPPVADGLGLGIRVPIIVISPYSIAGSINHTQGEFASIVKQIEETYGLPSLGNRDAGANDLSTYLNYSQVPISSAAFNSTNMPQRTGSNPLCQPASQAP